MYVHYFPYLHIYTLHINFFKKCLEKKNNNVEYHTSYFISMYIAYPLENRIHTAKILYRHILKYI